MLPGMKTTRMGLGIAFGLTLLLGLAMGLGRSVVYADDGDLDTSFDGDGKVTTDVVDSVDEVRAVAIQPDGKIVVAGSAFNRFALARYNPDGSLDTTFDVDGEFFRGVGDRHSAAYAVAIQPDGKIVAIGFSEIVFFGHFYEQAALIRLNPDGSMDPTFGTGGVMELLGWMGRANAAAIQPDGKIVVAGYSETEYYYDFTLWRLHSNGSPDDSFDSDGEVTTDFTGNIDQARAVAIQLDGKIVAAGNAQFSGFNYDFALVRYNSDGSLDGTFGSGGKVTTDFTGGDDGAYGMYIQPDGEIVAAGAFYSTGQGYDFGLARYLPNGAPDSSFDNDGFRVINFVAGAATEVALGVAMQTDGKIVAAGYAPVGGVNDFALVRLNTNGSLDTSFGGDGRINHDFGGGVALAYGVAIQSDGRIVSGGTVYSGDPDSYDLALARYLTGGPTSTPTPLPTIVINELDSDTPGTFDRGEFIELYDGGLGSTSLSGRVVVFFDGGSDTSYAAFDLDGYTTDGAGYFTLGNSFVPGIDLFFEDGLLDNGPGAVAFYFGDEAQFPPGTAITTANLLDAVVYDTSDPDDPGLLTLLNPGQPQVNENALGTGTTVSIARCPDGWGGTRNTNTYLPRPGTADGPNDCPFISQTPTRTSTTTPTSTPTPTPRPGVALYDQYNNNGNNGAYSNILANFPSFDALAADDFVVPAGQIWSIDQVDVRSLPGWPAQSTFNVYFYNDNSTIPGTPIYAASILSFHGANLDYIIPLTVPANLSSGAYWVAVQANMSGTYWFWATRSMQSGDPAAWFEGGGYGTGCSSWANRGNCTGTGGNPDQMFRLWGTSTADGTATSTSTRTSTPVPTATATACAPTLSGHLTYQGMPQPDAGNVQSATLMLQPAGGGPISPYSISTDQNANFIVNLGALSPGTYNWWLKSPRHLGTTGILTITAACTLTHEFGTQRAGDINNDNLVDVVDFSSLRSSFGKACGDSGYNPDAEYTGDCLVDVVDFNLLRRNFGQAGPPPP